MGKIKLFTACSTAALITAIGCQSNPPAPAQKTSGVITAFGSVMVNGVRFDTNGTQVYIDGEPASEEDLKVGMVVNVTGDGKNSTGEVDYDHDSDSDDDSDSEDDNALRVDADNEIEGIVVSNNIGPGAEEGTMTVMGQIVTVTLDTVFESEVASIVSIDQVAADHIVEISGFSNGDGEIFATRVELIALSFADFILDHSDGVELRGNISGLDEVNQTFNIGNLAVNYATAAVDNDEDGDSDSDSDSDVDYEGLRDGYFVEVKSVEGIINGVLIASEVERDDGGKRGHQGKSNDHYDFEGIITTGLSGSTFVVNGVTVRVEAGTVFENGDASALNLGVEVEVDGIFDATGTLVATMIEIELESDQDIEGTVSIVSVDVGEINTGTVTIGGQIIHINNSTMMKDERDQAPVDAFNLTFVTVGDYVEIRAYTDPATGNIVAEELEREDP